MKNALLSTRFRFLAVFGLMPSAESLEGKERKREEEFRKLEEFKHSDRLARYQELKEYIPSREFKQKKKEINAQKYKGSEPYKKENRYRQLIHSDPIKTYLKVKDSSDLDHYRKMEQSDELRHYYDLRDFFGSGEFQDFKDSLKEQQKSKKKQYKDTLAAYNKFNKKFGSYRKFRDSEEYTRYQNMKDSDKIQQYWKLKGMKKHRKNPEFKQLKRDPDVRDYLRTHQSKMLKKYNQLKDSDRLQQLDELEEKVHSDDFQAIPEEIRKLKFKNTEEYGRFKEYKKLSRKPAIKKALQFKDSKKFKTFQQAQDSELLDEYQQLKDYLESDEFREAKKYLKRKNKFKYSDTYQLLKEYRELKNAGDIKWYFKRKDSKDFDFQRKWEKTFYDDFSDGQFDENKWLTTYYWGKALLNESYVQAADKHFFTNGSNLQIDQGVLKIVTRKESVEGKAWHPNFGFYPKKFEYTSGIINTGQSFRQKYGIFRAKVKPSHAKYLRHSFWLVPDKILPEIDVFNYSRKNPRKLVLNAYSGNIKDKDSLKINQSVITGYNFSKRYTIFEIDWKPDAITWSINGVPVRKQKKHVPDESLFMILNSGVDGDIRDRDLPGELALDWVEAFAEKS